ncbi:putative disease resistance protein RGA3 [Impatiens glandulifera]|uniref:putative disease resistance protein RGA3 n=1 Tax=Impatiens glandulifera TaxID=253017 RepID=UPI001FB098B9|nr:putative disease resistance protein RGA3 [Impatiens glandulifera]
MDASSSSDGLSREIRHVTVMVDQLVKTSVCSLKKIGGLQSIMLDGRDDDGNVTNKILSAFKYLPSLRVLEVRCCVQYEDLRYVGYLKHLRYLYISYSQTTLPDSICDLLNLETLKLNNCPKLESLPINMRDLARRRDCQLDELRELNIRGRSLKIKNLGRVSDASISRGISMAKMSSINKLELEWRSDEDDEVDDNHTKTRHEKISIALEVSTARMKKLRMIGYKGLNPPEWVGNSSPSPTHFKSNYSSAISNDNEMIVLFPLLEELEIFDMMNLRKLVSPYWSTGAFPKLCTLKISDCPKLGRLPPDLKALKDVSIEGECSDELLYSILNLKGLTYLELGALNNDVEHIFTVNNKNGIEAVSFPFLKVLTIRNMNNLRALVSPTIPSSRAFPNVWKILIFDCPNLQSLPPHLKHKKHTILWHSYVPFEQDLVVRSLTISDCPKLVSSDEADDVLELLHYLGARLGPKNFYNYVDEETQDLETIINRCGYRNKMDIDNLMNYSSDNETCSEVQSLSDIVGTMIDNNTEDDGEDDTMSLEPIK